MTDKKANITFEQVARLDDIAPQLASFISARGTKRGRAVKKGDCLAICHLSGGLATEPLANAIFAACRTVSPDVLVTRTSETVEVLADNSQRLDEALSALSKITSSHFKSDQPLAVEWVVVDQLEAAYATDISATCNAYKPDPGDTLLILDVTPAAHGYSVANHVEKMPGSSRLCGIRSGGKAARVTMSLSKDDAKIILRGLGSSVKIQEVKR